MLRLGIQFQPRMHVAGREVEVGVKAMRVVGREKPGPWFHVHELCELFGRERGVSLAALLVDLEDAHHLVRRGAHAFDRVRGGGDLAAEGLGELGGFSVGIGHLQRHGVQGDGLRQAVVVGGERDRRVQADRAGRRVGDMGAKRGKPVHGGQSNPRGFVHGHVGNEIGLDVQGGEGDALEFARRRHPHALAQRGCPPRERGFLLDGPLRLDLHAGGQEPQDVFDEFH